MTLMDWIWTLAGLLMTLMVFSYLFGDNFLFRLATYIYIGVTCGYTLVIVVDYVLIPKLVQPLLAGDYLAVIPLVLSILLLTKLSPRTSRVGNIPMALLVGVGAAVAIGGAIFGTIAPQLVSTAQLFDLSVTGTGDPSTRLISGLFIALGLAASLLSFRFAGRKDPSHPNPSGNKFMIIIAEIGRSLVAIALGAIFAGVIVASLTTMVERLDTLWTIITGIIY
jgi:hypothetical protein